ncbi:MAG: glycosyltransferase family 39 protein [Acidobacteria bacterium]|jgi:hypothetical protein|nr:glycosyltransferase family 39 protein [Acidobacteriota bacterium]
MAKSGSQRAAADAPPERPGAGVAGERLAWLLLLVVVALVLVARVRLLDLPLERDEGEYAYAGQLLLQGVPPYAEADNMKLPGAYFAYAANMALFGQTARGVHLGLVAWNLAAIALLAALGRRLFGVAIGAAGAAAYAVLSLSPSVLGQAAHATQFLVAPLLGGCLLLAGDPAQRTAKRCGLAGLLFGIAFLTKQHAVFAILFGAAVVLYDAWAVARRPARERAVQLAAFAGGAVLPFALLCAFLAAQGLFANFWFWTFTYAARYVSAVPLGEGLRIFLVRLPQVIWFNAPLWLLALLGIAALAIGPWPRRSKLFLAGLAAASFLAVVPGLYFRHHYFVVLLPAIGLLAALGADGIARRLAPRARTALLVALVAAAAGVALYRQREPLYAWDATTFMRAVYTTNPFPESVEVADYLRRQAPAGARIAVLGSEPQIYFYSGHRAAARYIYAYALVEEHPFAARLQQQTAREIEEARPEFVVWARADYSWLERPGASRFIFDWAEKYLGEHYRLEGVVEVPEDGIGRAVWGDEAASYRPRTKDHLLVYRRR